jgi:hypothetical protein
VLLTLTFKASSSSNKNEFAEELACVGRPVVRDSLDRARLKRLCIGGLAVFGVDSECYIPFDEWLFLRYGLLGVFLDVFAKKTFSFGI